MTSKAACASTTAAAAAEEPIAVKSTAVAESAKLKELTVLSTTVVMESSKGTSKTAADVEFEVTSVLVEDGNVAVDETTAVPSSSQGVAKAV